MKVDESRRDRMRVSGQTTERERVFELSATLVTPRFSRFVFLSRALHAFMMCSRALKLFSLEVIICSLLINK